MTAGSTEQMESESINEKLKDIVGISGIGVSYQTFHQSGITPKMWVEATQRTDIKIKNKKSREYYKMKYAWAPEGLCVYVSKEADVSKARAVLLEKYGECNKDGTIPVWPGGSRMRFIPLKSTYIKNTNTRTKVEKRITYHIIIKVKEEVIVTEYQNIDGTIESFNGKTFQEVIMDIDSETIENVKLFRHFKHTWTPDPHKTKWSLSVHSSMKKEAQEKVDNLKEEFVKKMATKLSSSSLSRRDHIVTMHLKEKPSRRKTRTMMIGLAMKTISSVHKKRVSLLKECQNFLVMTKTQTLMVTPHGDHHTRENFQILQVGLLVRHQQVL